MRIDDCKQGVWPPPYSISCREARAIAKLSRATITRMLRVLARKGRQSRRRACKHVYLGFGSSRGLRHALSGRKVCPPQDAVAAMSTTGARARLRSLTRSGTKNEQNRSKQNKTKQKRSEQNMFCFVPNAFAQASQGGVNATPIPNDFAVTCRSYRSDYSG